MAKFKFNLLDFAVAGGKQMPAPSLVCENIVKDGAVCWVALLLATV